VQGTNAIRYFLKSRTINLEILTLNLRITNFWIHTTDYCTENLFYWTLRYPNSNSTQK